MASILVVVDRFSKYGIFIAAPHACPAETAAELFFKNVTKFFGVPKDIVSDRDVRFTGRFWTALFNMMGTELKFSTANHPQTDARRRGLWATTKTPHEISVQRSGGKCPAAYRYARSKQELLDEARDSLAKAQRRMKKYADMGRRHVEFSAGDQVLLKLTPQIWKKISSKSVHRGLIPKYDGPFEDLLDAARQQTQRAPPVIRKEFEKTVLKILDHRTMGQSKKESTNRLLGSLVGDGVTSTRASGFLVGVVCNPLLSWCPALVWQAYAPGRRTVSAWGDTARHSQTDGRSGCKRQCARAACCAQWADGLADATLCGSVRAALGSVRTDRAAGQLALDSAAVGSCAHSSAAVRWNSAVGLGSKGWGSAAARHRAVTVGY
ncbi:hypothetical protein Sango_2710300 [Sesamum angolense]|uniref:Integrase catalytic domain-containing protein n=1 Tax=Sesamum angolense TaxID=2727404 RepID=A0AAE2BHR7_9LAMI|nr:hypothetical protein Sango_2710300 [Sesamum angolense]